MTTVLEERLTANSARLAAHGGVLAVSKSENWTSSSQGGAWFDLEGGGGKKVAVEL